jgi:hypothetical protein
MEEPDFYLDPEVSQDPYPFYERMRSQCPVLLERYHQSILVSGYAETIAVAKDSHSYSACNAMTGPFCGFPGAPPGAGDVTELERILDRMADIRISESHHGPAGDRHYEFTKWYLLRRPMQLHLEFTPAS